MDSTNKAVQHDPISRKRKSEPVNETPLKRQTPAKKSKSLTNLVGEDDKIDPVENLLCLPNLNNDILFDLDTDDSSSEPASPRSVKHSSSSSSSVSTDTAYFSELESSPLHSPYPNMDVNFSKVINDNLRSYYLSTYKSPIEIHNDNSSFSILNKKTSQHANGETALPTQTNAEVPFFKNVNFNPKPKSGNSIDDYLYYDDDDFSSSTTELGHEGNTPSSTCMTQLPNISFHYRRDNKLNLSLSNQAPCSEPHDVSKILNQNSVFTGKASEMVGTSRLLINDFFL